MRIIYQNQGFNVDGLHLALHYLEKLNITPLKMRYQWPGFIYLKEQSDYIKLKQAINQ